MKKGLKIALGASLSVALAGANLVPALVSAWGDSDGGRPSYTVDQINHGAINDKIVLNSISDGEIGNEKDFVAARLDGSSDWYGTEINVEDGKTYVVRLYVHNNNPRATEMVAKGVNVKYSIPSKSATSIEVNGIIDTENADPLSYWDNVVFKSNQNFHLEYISGSAKINGNGKTGGSTLSDSIVTNAGALIGYDSLNGEIPGCFKYAQYITLKVKATYDYDFEVAKKVRIKGTSGWNESVDAKVGDEVEYQIHYKNTSGVVAKNVILKDILPSNITYVNGSTVLYAGKYAKTGLALESNGVTTDGINIGDYAAGAGAYVRFTAKVVDTNLGCGNNTLTNWAQVYVGENGTNQMKQDDADVIVAKTCTDPTPTTPTPTTPTELPQTGAGSIVGSALGLGSIVTSAGYYISSRKKLA